MRKLNLTTWERLQLIKSIPQTVPTAELNKHVSLVELLSLSEEENALVGLTMLSNGSAVWKDTEREFEILLEDAEYDLINKLVIARQDWIVTRLSLVLIEKVAHADRFDIREGTHAKQPVK